VNIVRFPALALGALASIGQVLPALAFSVTPNQQSLIAALIVAILGAGTSWLTKGDSLVASLVAVGQAMLALMLGFGLHLSPDLQGAIMALVAAAAAAYVHTQVSAPVPPEPGSSPLEPSVPVPPPPS
jgi:hypothetical protein